MWSDHDALLAATMLFRAQSGDYGQEAARSTRELDVFSFKDNLIERLHADLRDAYDKHPQRAAEDVAVLCRSWTGPSLSDHIRREGTLDQVVELVTQRSITQLIEADPQLMLIPRMRGRAKLGFIEVMVDELGMGKPHRHHAQLWGAAMRGLGLDDTPFAYTAQATAAALVPYVWQMMCAEDPTLVNVGVGYYSAVELTSSTAMAGYVKGMQRLGLGAEVMEYFQEHAIADALHEHLMVRDVIEPLCQDDPPAGADVHFGAFTYLFLSDVLADELLSLWVQRHGSPLHTQAA